MSQSNHTEERLVELARSGDRGAQHQLWHAHRRWVAAIVLAHRPRTIEVDDLMQDVAVKFVGRLHTLRDAGAFRPWLRRIVINICRGAARSQKPTLRLAGAERGDEAFLNGAVAAPAAATEEADKGVARREAAHRLLRQAMTLPPEYREPLLLRCVRNMSYLQMSELLELPVTTIETRLARARRMLREEVGEIIGEDAG